MRFGDVLAAEQAFQLARELLALNREALRLTEERARSGAVPELDASILGVEVNRLETLQIDAEARLGVAVLELKSLVGMKPDESLRLRGTLDPSVIADTVVDAVLANRPDLQALGEAERVAEARVNQAKAEGRLDASLSASYQRSDSGFPINGLTSQGQITRIQSIFHLATVGMSINLPIRNRNGGAIASAVAEWEAAKRRREYAELVATREVVSARLLRDKAQESLAIFGSGVRDRSRQNLVVIRRVYELGRNQLLDVIAEQRRLIDVEMGYIDAMNRYYQATIRLRLALGQ
jgi:outer membrane protein TolC